jgi:hypothetical protein
MSLASIRKKNSTETSILYKGSIEEIKLSPKEIEESKAIFYNIVEPINKKTFLSYVKNLEKN